MDTYSFLIKFDLKNKIVRLKYDLLHKSSLSILVFRIYFVLKFTSPIFVLVFIT